MNIHRDVYDKKCCCKGSKELKALKYKTETELLSRIGFLLSEPDLSCEEQLEVKEIQLKIDPIYIELAKGAFVRSRAKWPEEGEQTQTTFFALEKRNGQRKSLSMLNINSRFKIQEIFIVIGHSHVNQ